MMGNLEMLSILDKCSGALFETTHQTNGSKTKKLVKINKLYFYINTLFLKYFFSFALISFGQYCGKLNLFFSESLMG